MKDKGRKYDLSYFIKHGGSPGWTKVPFKSRNKGKKSELREKAGFFNKGSSGLTGLSKLAAAPSSGKSEKYRRAANAAAKKIAQELDDQFSSRMKAPGLFQKQEERRKIERKKERTERKELDQASQKNAETFMQAMRSGEYNQEELLKNFCRIPNPAIKESIIISAFIPIFLQNINEIKAYIQEQGNYQKLSDNYYSLESSYRKIFNLFMRSCNLFSIPSFRISLSNLLVNMQLDIKELNKLIDNIIKNEFNMGLARDLRAWIDNFKEVGHRKYDVNANKLDKDFVFDEEQDNENIEDILKEFMIRQYLLDLGKFELDGTFLKKLYYKIIIHTAEDKVPGIIDSIKNILGGDGTLNRLIKKFEMGYFSEEQINKLMELLSIFSKNLEPINNELKSFEEEFFNKDKEKEIIVELKEKFKNISNISQREKEITQGLEKFRKEREDMFEKKKKKS